MTKKKKPATVACVATVGIDLEDGRYEPGEPLDLPAGHWLIEQGLATVKEN